MKKFFFFAFIMFFVSNCDSQKEIKTISTKELKTLMAEEKIQLLDVRTPDEIGKGHIKSAIFINYFDDNFSETSTKLLDKNKLVYVVCRSGNRSTKACKILKEEGFEVVNVLGGYNQWKKEN
ncbi:rhodanese-like domain-containing protein [Polaribacter aestuariivivens]|uniref:rhodanese-like domain-containing protein n=1 Tax=Polaribacter aestuariivivens TaxID=2304626 RepID=UPI003F491DE9